MAHMPQDGDGIRFFRNHLPQWRLDGGVYFVTWRLHARGDQLTPPERSIVADAIRHFKDVRYRLSIFVVMDDHVHLVLQTLPGFDLSKILQSLKTFTATRINRLRGRSGALWQKDSYTELLGNEAAIQTRREYVYPIPSANGECRATSTCGWSGSTETPETATGRRRHWESKAVLFTQCRKRELKPRPQSYSSISGVAGFGSNPASR
jgi:REP element-mobilizing transposase RayT